MFNGKRLAFLRTNKGINQSNLAKDIGMTRSTIGMYEQGKRQPSADVIESFAKYFNVTIDYFFEEDSNNIKREVEKAILIKNISEKIKEPIYLEFYRKLGMLKDDDDRKQILNIINKFNDERDKEN